MDDRMTDLYMKIEAGTMHTHISGDTWIRAEAGQLPTVMLAALPAAALR